MRKRFKKLSVVLISSVLVSLLPFQAFCAPKGMKSREDCAEEKILEIAESRAQGNPNGENDFKLSEKKFNIIPCEGVDGSDEMTTYVSYFGEVCPIDGFAGKDINNTNSKIKTLIYTSGSFDAERYHKILSLNKIVSEGKSNSRWELRIISSSRKDALCRLRAEFKNRKEGKKIIFCFNPLGIKRNLKRSGTIAEAVEYCNGLLKECGINQKISISRKIFCEINKNILDSIGNSNDFVFKGQKYENVKDLMEDYNFKVLRFKGDVTMMRFCGDNSLINVGIQGPVYEIRDYAFNCCKCLKNIILPNFLLEIGEGAFQYCESLESINIPDYVTKIGRNAFNGCKNLKHIEYKGVTYCSLEDFKKVFDTKILEIEDKVGFRQFYSRKDLKDVEIHGSVNEICDNAFERCINLENITIPDSVNTVGDHVFLGCYGLKSIRYKGKSYHSEEDFRRAAGTKILDKCAKVSYDPLFRSRNFKYIKIPEQVESIGVGAFKNCINLREVVMPSTLKVIDAEAFKGCISLRSINIPDSVEQIEIGAFDFCESLNHIEYKGEVYSNIYDLFKQFVSLETVLEVNGPIGYKYFSKRDDLKYVEIRGFVPMICEKAFEGCFSLERIILPNTLRTISKKVFKNCYALREIVIPGSVENIAVDAFKGCCSLNIIRYNGRCYNNLEEFLEEFNNRKNEISQKGYYHNEN